MNPQIIATAKKFNPYTKEEYKTAAQTLDAMVDASNKAELSSILSDFFQLACEDGQWARAWRDVRFELEAL